MNSCHGMIYKQMDFDVFLRKFYLVQKEGNNRI